MKAKRDTRDPSLLGERYLALRGMGDSIDAAVYANVPDYEDGGFISSNPEEHHSKTPQNLGDLSDGGEA